jgi:hypothetical protein
MNHPLSLNRWNYVEGNPITLSDPSGLFGITDISASFGISDTNDLGKLFQPGGHLAGKWGYLKFLVEAQFSAPGSDDYILWHETGYSDPTGVNSVYPNNKNIFYRPNVASNPCPVMPWYLAPSNGGCYADGKMVSAGYFDVKNNSIIWVDKISGRQMSLLNLGHINADWYDVGYDMYYAYEPYSMNGYDWSKVDKLSLAANSSGVLTACAVALCPFTEGVTCAAIPFLIVSTVSLGFVSTSSDLNQVELGNPDAPVNVALDFCSMIPKNLGGICSTAGLGRTLGSGYVHIK